MAEVVLNRSWLVVTEVRCHWLGRKELGHLDWFLFRRWMRERVGMEVDRMDLHRSRPRLSMEEYRQMGTARTILPEEDMDDGDDDEEEGEDDGAGPLPAASKF